MSRPLRPLAISLALLGASCAGESPKPKLAPRPIAASPPAPASVTRAIDVERPPDSYRGFPVSLPPLLSPELGPYYERLAAKLDPRSWYLWVEQSPPRGFRGLRKRGAFPGGPYTLIRAYESGRAGLYPGPPLFDWPKGCHGALANDGTLCPSTVAPGLTLSAAQERELIAIVNEVDPVPRVVMNGYNFVHRFVVFDEADVPVAQVSVDLGGIKLWSEPSQKKNAVDTLDPARRERMGRLLAELGLLVPEGSELDRNLQRQGELDGGKAEVRYLPAASGVPLDVPLDRTTPVQRERLCMWQQLLFLKGAPHSAREGGSGIECDDGVRAIATGSLDCTLKFPSCSATVGVLEACLRRMRVDPCFAKQPGGEACLELRPCLWGAEWSLRPPLPDPSASQD
jgi:hypothetical protein